MTGERSHPGWRLEWLAVAVLSLTTALVPLAWAGFRPEGRMFLLIGWSLAGLIWLLALVQAGRRPAVPRGALVAALLLALLAGGALMRSLPEPADSFTDRHLERLAERWPESFQRPGAPFSTSLVVAALLAGLAAADLGRRRGAQLTLLGAVAAAGVLTAVVGLTHNALGIDTIYGEAHRVPGRSFGAFFHHTAAGAQVNLALAVVVAMLLGLLHRRRQGQASPIWAWMAVGLAWMLLVAAHAGNIARLPPVAGLAGMLAVVLVAGWPRRDGKLAARGGRLALLAAALVVFGAGAWLVTRTHQFESMGERWRSLVRKDIPAGERRMPPPVEEWESRLRADYLIPSDFRGIFMNDRGAAWAVALRAIADRPLSGWGPGGWAVAASHHTGEPFLRTFYLYVQFTHQDILQAAVVWGVPGACLWLFLALGGWMRRRPGPGERRDRTLDAALAGCTVAIGLQAMVDFPLQIPSVQAGFLVVAALSWRQLDERTPEPPAAP